MSDHATPTVLTGVHTLQKFPRPEGHLKPGLSSPMPFLFSLRKFLHRLNRTQVKRTKKFRVTLLFSLKIFNSNPSKGGRLARHSLATFYGALTCLT